MAGPISGYGAGQQVSLSSLTIGQNNNQARGQEERVAPREDQVQPQSTAAAQSQESEADNNQSEFLLRQLESEDFRAEQKEAERGSLVDITV